ncbi:MAG TPA: molybdopterin cofactor-binding domain-containing protein [Steroidobacteraceae bacterium]
MRALERPAPSRRGFLLGGGALIVSFSLPLRLAMAQQPAEKKLPGSLQRTARLDSWIRIDDRGAITVFTGKCELGQGIKTALMQVAAEELAVAAESIHLVTADTALTPNEGYTAGSHSMQDSGTAIRYAAAQARSLLIDAAAARLDVPRERLKAQDGAVVADDGRRLGFGALVKDELLHVAADGQSALTDAAHYRLIGMRVPRVDIPAKVSGGGAFVQDLRLPGMVHARVVRPPSYHATLVRLDTTPIAKLPGVRTVHRDGNYLAVIAEHEYQAVVAMQALAGAATWNETATLPEPDKIFDWLASQPAEQVPVLAGSGRLTGGTRILAATYRRAYQMHGSIGPSCAVAQFESDQLTVWTHSQGVFPLRAAIAQLVQLPTERVRCVQIDGSGCYGHNGADDAAADAALLAMALPGHPIRVQWTREQEHAWEPYGSAMITKVRAALGAQGRISGWDYSVRSCTHATRAGPAGNLLPAWLLAHPSTPPPPQPLPLPEGGGHRNAAPLYSIPDARVVYEFVSAMPLRVSALRSLGAYMNVFSIESFMDELAQAAKADPVDFRLRHVDDPRARAVIKVAAEHFGWADYHTRQDHGRGFAFARYKNLAAYLAVAAEVQVDRQRRRLRLKRAVAAVDCGEAVNPDGIENQIAGGIIQSASWTLHERVAFDRMRITSRDWNSYPILRFSEIPDEIEVRVLNQPGTPFLGTGEAAQGPTAAAIANAIADATGTRLRDIPLTLP